MADHFNKLSPAQAERLALVAEECGEVLQIIGKILRHGYESHHPDGGPPNRNLLEREIGDLKHAISRLTDHDLNSIAVGVAQRAKAAKVGRYLHHQD